MRVDRLSLKLALAFFFVLLLYTGGKPEKLYFDEVHYVPAGKVLISEGSNINPEHPPLAKFLIGLSSNVFETGVGEPLSFRLASILVGVLGLYWLFRLLLVIGFIPLHALCAVLLTAFNFLWFVQAKIAMLDIFYVSFSICALAWAAERRKWKSIVAFACACAAKWTALLYVPALIVAYGMTKADRASLKRELWRYGLLLAVVTVGLRTVLGGLFFGELSLDWVSYEFKLLLDIRNTFSHPYESSIWQWPFLIRPIWYSFFGSTIEGASSSGIWAGGNPLIWWLGLISLFYTAIRLWRSNTQTEFTTALFLILGYLSPMLFWLIAPPHPRFFYYFLPSSMWLGPLIVYSVSRLLREPRRQKVTLATILVLSAGLFIYFLPILTDSSVSSERFRALMWFDSWI